MGPSDPWSTISCPHAADPNCVPSKLVQEAADEGICFRGFMLGQSQPIKRILHMHTAAPTQSKA